MHLFNFDSSHIFLTVRTLVGMEIISILCQVIVDELIPGDERHRYLEIEADKKMLDLKVKS